MSRNICSQDGRISISAAVTPRASINWWALVRVSLLVANPGIVYAKMFFRDQPSRSMVLAATIKA